MRLVLDTLYFVHNWSLGSVFPILWYNQESLDLLKQPWVQMGRTRLGSQQGNVNLTLWPSAWSHWGSNTHKASAMVELGLRGGDRLMGIIKPVRGRDNERLCCTESDQQDVTGAAGLEGGAGARGL